MSGIAIVGAGLGGLTTALALLRAGKACTIHEQAPALGEVGAGITISPNAAKALIALGLGPALEAVAEEPPFNEVRAAADDSLVARIPRERTRETYGAPYWMLHRADLHALLVEAVRALDADAIRLNARVAPGDTLGAEVLIGADGVKSAVRAAVTGPDEPVFSGHVAWRCLAPGALVAGELSAPGSITWAGEGRSATLYPVRGGALVNCVALTRSDAWAGEGWSHAAAPGAVVAALAGFPAPVLDAFAAGEAAEGVKCWGLFTRPPVERLVKGRVALIGDAAHPMPPFLGQGAAMAIEDGLVLARCLIAYPEREAALAAYEAARLARVRFVQDESNAGADRLQTRMTEDLRDKPRRDENALDLFAYDPATTPI